MFRVNDIVKNAPGWRPGVYVIAGIVTTRPKNPYTAVSLVTGKVFRLSQECLAAKRIGVADTDWRKVSDVSEDQPMEESEMYLNGLRRCRRELQEIGGLPNQDRLRWEKLKSLKPGDKFKINLRGDEKTLTFRYVTDRGYKYVFVADNDKGTRYKYPLSVICV
jgi:hypothetical protein